MRVLALGGAAPWEAEARRVGSALQALTGEPVGVLHAASVDTARARFVSSVRGSARPRALVLLPHASALAASEPTASALDGAASSMVELLLELRRRRRAAQ